MAHLVKMAIKHNKKMFKKGHVLSKEDVDHLGDSFSSFEDQGYFGEASKSDVAVHEVMAAAEAKKAPVAQKVDKK